MSVIILIVKHPHQDLPLPSSFPPPGLSPWLLSAATNVTRRSHDDPMTSSWSRSSWRHWQWRMLLAHISSQQILGPFAWFAWGIHKTQHDMRILCLSYGLHFPQPTSDNFPPQAGASCWRKTGILLKKKPRGFPQKQKLKNNKHQATKCPEVNGPFLINLLAPDDDDSCRECESATAKVMHSTYRPAAHRCDATY